MLRSPGSIAAVKRQLSGAVVALRHRRPGPWSSACNVTPPAATANGTDISTATLNTQLRTLESTQPAAACCSSRTPS